MQKHCWTASSIGRKQLIGLTGLGLSLFVLVHMLGNCLIFVSPQAYNEYGHSLTSNRLIFLAEAGLLAMFVGHLMFASWISIKNIKARSVGYAVRSNGEKGTSWAKRSLWAQGLLILVFVILHLITFKFGTDYRVDYGHGEIRDLAKLMFEVFNDPVYVSWYVLAVAVLGVHLSHGVGSSLQTFGINHPKWNCSIKLVSFLYGVIVAVGFSAQPLYVFLFN
jgi:succinate dehydrogenase / fumarate reductase cytochrome b subunit